MVGKSQNALMLYTIMLHKWWIRLIKSMMGFNIHVRRESITLMYSKIILWFSN